MYNVRIKSGGRKGRRKSMKVTREREREKKGN